MIKKILFIHHAIGWGGAPISMINQINSLDRSKYDVEVLLLKHSIVADRLTENNIKYKVSESLFYRRCYRYFTHSEAGYVRWYQVDRLCRLILLWVLSRCYFAKKELKKHEFDIVHLNSSVLTDWLAPAKKKGKVIIQIREPYRKGRFDILHPFFTNQMRKFADQIIAISQDNSNRIGICEKTKVIYNYTEIPKCQPPENSYSSKKFLYLGGAAKIKGFYTLVEALDYLSKDVMVYFGGSCLTGKYSHNIIKRIIQFLFIMGKKNKVIIHKMKNHPNVIEVGLTNNIQKYLDEVCCLISPFSVPHFSRPVIEAFAHKKPSIGSNVNGMDELIDHNVNGLIVEKNNPKKLAEAMNYLADHPEAIKRMGEQGYNKAIKFYSSKNIKMFETIYNNMFKNNEEKK